jgi:hypothetical protein
MQDGPEPEAEIMRCKGVTKDGRACKAPDALVDPTTGYCFAHDPTQEDARRDAYLKGSRRGDEARRKEALRSKSFLAADELPPLTDPNAAAKWCEIVGRAIGATRIGGNQGQAILRAVETFLRCHDAGKATEELEALKEKVAELSRDRLSVA